MWTQQQTNKINVTNFIAIYFSRPLEASHSGFMVLMGDLSQGTLILQILSLFPSNVRANIDSKLVPKNSASFLVWIKYLSCICLANDSIIVEGFYSACIDDLYFY